jgi:hypothetical protein
MKSLIEFLRSEVNSYRIAYSYYIEFTKPVIIVTSGINLADFKVVIIAGDRVTTGNRFVTFEEFITMGEYVRATFHVVDYNADIDFDDPREISKYRLVGRDCKFRATVNESILRPIGQLLLGFNSDGNSGDDPEPEIMQQYRAAVKALKDNEAFREEFFGINIDDPEYGILDDKLYMVNKDDSYIRAFIGFERIDNGSLKSDSDKAINIITFYYFDENLQEMISHIPSRFVRYHNTRLVAEVDFAMDGKVASDKDAVVEIPLSDCFMGKADIDKVIKLFNRTYAYDE